MGCLWLVATVHRQRPAAMNGRLGLVCLWFMVRASRNESKSKARREKRDQEQADGHAYYCLADKP